MGLLQEVTTVHHHDQALHLLHPLVQPGLLHPLAKQGGASQRFARGYHHRADPEPCWRNTWGRRNNHTSSTRKWKPDPDPPWPVVPHHHPCYHHHLHHH